MTETLQKKIVRYTLTVYVDRPVYYGDGDGEFTPAEHEAWHVSREATRELEREISQALRKLDGDVDCECMEATIDTD